MADEDDATAPARAAIADTLTAVARREPERAAYLTGLAAQFRAGKQCLVPSWLVIDIVEGLLSGTRNPVAPPVACSGDLIPRGAVMDAACHAVADAWDKKNVSVAGALIDAINAVPSVNPAKRPVEESLTRRMMAAQASEAAERGEPYNERMGG